MPDTEDLFPQVEDRLWNSSFCETIPHSVSIALGFGGSRNRHEVDVEQVMWEIYSHDRADHV